LLVITIVEYHEDVAHPIGVEPMTFASGEQTDETG